MCWLGASQTLLDRSKRKDTRISESFYTTPSLPGSRIISLLQTGALGSCGVALVMVRLIQFNQLIRRSSAEKTERFQAELAEIIDKNVHK
jgi:hypothetical protein